MEKIKGHSTQDINALERNTRTLKGHYFSAEGCLSMVYVIFPLINKLGRVVYNLIISHFKPLLVDLSVKFY